MKKINSIVIMIISCMVTIGFVACGKPAQEEDAASKVLVLATFDDSSYIQEQVEQYNQNQKEYRIVIKRYVRAEQPEEDGILLLQREIASGKGPDIIDFGNGFTTSDIVGEYTEDLFSYMNEEEMQRYFENVLHAFSYEEKLYAIPLSFTLKSLVGSAQNVEGYGCWTIGEMMDCYRKQAGERLLYPGAFKRDVLGTILTGSMEYYIDWETGECDFDGAEFGDVLQFCNQFPERLEIAEDFSAKRTFAEDKALLLPVNIRSVYDMCRVEAVFDNREISYVGFPVDGNSGTILESCGFALAISRNSSNKQEAWAFISQCLSDVGQKELPSGFPICRKALEEQIAQALKVETITNAEGKEEKLVRYEVIFEGEEKIPIYCITPEQAEQLLALIEGAEIVSQTEPKIYNVFLEEAEYYFDGAKGLEETMEVIQSRVSLYVNERI